MIGKYLPAVAIIGLAVAIGTVIQGNQTTPLVEPAVQSAKVPFASYVAGAGMIEASTENIAIGTPVSGIVAAIYVTWGDRVNAGEPLFKIRPRFAGPTPGRRRQGQGVRGNPREDKEFAQDRRGLKNWELYQRRGFGEPPL